jgi:hypothetical protein
MSCWSGGNCVENQSADARLSKRRGDEVIRSAEKFVGLTPEMSAHEKNRMVDGSPSIHSGFAAIAFYLKVVFEPHRQAPQIRIVDVEIVCAGPDAKVFTEIEYGADAQGETGRVTQRPGKG